MGSVLLVISGPNLVPDLVDEHSYYGYPFLRKNHQNYEDVLITVSVSFPYFLGIDAAGAATGVPEEGLRQC